MTCRQALLAALLCAAPVLCWVTGQILMSSAGQVPAVVRPASDSLLLLIVVACCICIPLLHGARSGLQPWLAAMLLPLIPAPLHVLTWQLGGAHAGSLLSALVLTLAFALILTGLATMLNKWLPVTARLHQAASVALAGLALITFILNLDTWQNWLQI